MLGALGVASAHTLLWAFGCGGPARSIRTTPDLHRDEVRTWLHDAVARLDGAGLGSPHALAVSRQRATAAIDTLGESVVRVRCDGVVLSVIDAGGARREQVTTDLSADGVAAAVHALAAGARPARAASGKPEVWRTGEGAPGDAELLDQLRRLGQLDQATTSRIVYRAELVDIDDATVWSVAHGHDREQRLVRVRQSATRVAWNGTRPVIGDAARAWLGAPGDQALGKAELEAATRDALAMMTPGAFPDGELAVLLAPSIVAQLVDAAAAALWTAAAARRPDVARRCAIGAQIAAPELALVDDPTAGGAFDAYGAYAFDDTGAPAAPVTLIDHGRIAARLAARRRAGHIGRIDDTASHLRLELGGSETAVEDGFVLDGALGAAVDAASDRIVVSVARANELRGGRQTGRVYADIELIGELAALLGSARRGTGSMQRVGLRPELDGQPSWRSIDAPWLHAKARLRARRRAS
jgi:predicted Zn-dependent protease